VPIDVRYVTDPACAWSWGSEPTLRRLRHESGDELSLTPVMAGMARRYPPEAAAALAGQWLEVAGRTRMPLDPRGWWDAPLATTYPACLAVKAAQEQGAEAGERLLRALREGILCFRRKLDGADALVEEARRAGLDAARFRIDLNSSAVVEAFGRDLDEARSAGAEPPALLFPRPDGTFDVVDLRDPYEDVYEDVRAAAERAGAGPRTTERPSPLDALRRLGRLASPELEAVCNLPEPPLLAELWRLVAEWRVRPVRVLTGHLWEVA
jgi:predicted DsbA family dithiol-disulfide isomerase